ncbi:MAG: maleylpyruvate isomerase N-terminal domain-containing protein [Acidimicrobiales bacterium]|jgi:maleylpyruvate isomerase
MTDNGAVPGRPPTDVVAACRASHERLFERLEVVDEVVVRRPSRLPGWTVAHVLTHVARNADSFVRILEAAGEGQQVSQYASGAPQRTGEIEAGAARSSASIVNDVRSTARRLDTAFSAADLGTWSGTWTLMSGQVAPCTSLPARRLREVEFHHVDLGLGYESSDWPAEFVAGALADVLEALPGRIGDLAQRARLLAWVGGRSDSPLPIDMAPF